MPHLSNMSMGSDWLRGRIFLLVERVRIATFAWSYGWFLPRPFAVNSNYFALMHPYKHMVASMDVLLVPKPVRGHRGYGAHAGRELAQV